MTNVDVNVNDVKIFIAAVTAEFYRKTVETAQKNIQYNCVRTTSRVIETKYHPTNINTNQSLFFIGAFLPIKELAICSGRE